MKYLIIIVCLSFSTKLYSQHFNSLKRISDANTVSIIYSRNISLNPSKLLSEKSNDFDTTYIQPATQPTAVDFILPLKNLKITSSYGDRFHPIDKKHKFHAGSDFRANADTVYSMLKGIVDKSGYNKALGYYVKVKSDSITAIYGHLKCYFFLNGEAVNAGDAIGITGNTGKSTGEHLHLSIINNKKYIDPIEFIINKIKPENHEQPF